MTVKITKCSHSMSWHRDHIGDVFKVFEILWTYNKSEIVSYVVWRGDEQWHICPEDVEVIENFGV